jgi:PelA/Pel-15E family pectate lyase
MSSATVFLALVILAPAIPAQTTRVVLVGDSTVQDESGWGPGFTASFGAPVEITNAARGGRSSKSFLGENRWVPVLAAKPNYILIQFGHNDGPGKGPERETDPKTTFRANMGRYVDEARAAGATPVLVTPIVRRNFDANGKLRPDNLAAYAEAVRELATEKHVALIDLYALTKVLAEKLGDPGAESLGTKTADGKQDHTHLGPKGAQLIGAMAAAELVKVAPQLKPYFHLMVDWKSAMHQPRSWYGGPEAIRIADNLLVYQHNNGGWEKNIDMATPMSVNARAAVEKQKSEAHTTIDNDATYTQMQFLARVYSAAKQEKYRTAFEKGLGYLLEAQYPNGGWPQFYPLRAGYWSHITYNDDAMVGVLKTLQMIVNRAPGYEFIDDATRARAKGAMERGIECILKTQVEMNGKLTVWCAQHDEKTLAPAKARAYELPSLSGSESVGIVEFLMSIDHPSPRIIHAVQSAVEWFKESKVAGIRLDRQSAPGTPKGYDLLVVPDASAPPLWARFYELNTNRPMFCGRDGIVKYSVAEIEYERRNGYRWYVDRPAKLLSQEYPKWASKYAPSK